MPDSPALPPPSGPEIARGAAISGVINGVINGAIQWYLLADHAPLPLTVDGITNDDHTVFGAAVPLAVSLAMILTAIGYFTVKGPKAPFFPAFLLLTLKHGFLALGVFVTGAVFWQRIVGTVSVSLPVAVLILGVAAGLVSAWVNYLTVREASASGG